MILKIDDLVHLKAFEDQSELLSKVTQNRKILFSISIMKSGDIWLFNHEKEYQSKQ